MRDVSVVRGFKLNTYPYESESFYQCWWKHLAPRFPIEKRVDNFAVVTRPLMKKMMHVKELRIAGWNNSSISQDFTPERARQFESFADSTQWDYLKFTWLKEREAYQDWSVFEKQGYAILQVPSLPDPVIDTTRDWEAFLALKSKRVRQSIRRRLRKAQELNVEFRVMGDTPREIEAFCQQLFNYHIPYWNARVGYSYLRDVQEQKFIIDWAKELAKEKALLLYNVYLSGDLVTMSLGIVGDGTLYTPLTIVTGNLLEYSPGQVTLCMEIQHAMNSEIKRISLCPGDEEYKRHYATDYAERYTMIVPNKRSIKGKLYASLVARQKKATTCLSAEKEN